MRTNLNGCFVAFTLGTPLFVAAQFADDHVLRHVVTESKDYDKIPLPLPPSGWAGFNVKFFLYPNHQTLRTSCKQEAERLTTRSTAFGITRVGWSGAPLQKIEMRFRSRRGEKMC